MLIIMVVFFDYEKFTIKMHPSMNGRFFVIITNDQKMTLHFFSLVFIKIETF